MNKAEVLRLECDCSLPQHSIKITNFENDRCLYVDVALNRLPLWQRVKVGVKYILGVETSHQYEDVILEEDHLVKLRNMINQVLAVELVPTTDEEKEARANQLFNPPIREKLEPIGWGNAIKNYINYKEKV